MEVIRTADRHVLLPPPMLWIFEWDIVSAGNSVLSNLYYSSKEKIDQMIAEGREAVIEAKNMKRRLTAIQPKITHNHMLSPAKVLNSPPRLRYQ